MNIRIKKRSFVRIVSYISALVLVLGVFCARELYEDAYKVPDDMLAGYNENFSTLSTSLNNLSGILRKYPYVHSAYGLSVLASEIQYEAGMAKSALEGLPVSAMNLSNTTKLFSQVGDYVFMIAKKAINGEQISESENEVMLSFAEKAGALADRIALLEAELLDSNSEPDAIMELFFDDDSKVDPDTYALRQEDAKLGADQSYLVYDGAYSDSAISGGYEFLRESEQISEAEALAEARKFIDSEDLRYVGSVEDDNIPCYYFTSGDQDVFISRLGGYAVSYSYNRASGDVTITEEQAEQKAVEYLASHGYPDMSAVYAYPSGNVYYITLAYTGGDVLYLGDIITVGIAADNGGVVLMNAGGYLRNHGVEQQPEFELTQEQAAEKLNGIEAASVRKVMLLTDGGYDKSCYEFTIDAGEGQTVLVYINAANGNEERVLIVVEDENGRYVI